MTMHPDGSAPGTQATFADSLRQKAAEKAEEYAKLSHEQRRYAIQAERCKSYIENLNRLLEAEGLPPVKVKEAVRKGGIGVPGNRSQNMPLRRKEWEGMSLSQIVATILNETNEALHADTIVPRIYEVETQQEKRRAKHTLVGTLRHGVKEKWWQGLGKNRYCGKDRQPVLLSR